jgi:iron(III) transport system permease protein
VVLAIACILLFLRPLPLLGVSIYATPFIIVFAYLARFLPLALKPPLAAMAVLARDQEEASALDGANAWQRLRHIIVPNLLPAAAAGALLVFLLGFNELTVSALLWTAGTETLGVALFSLEDAGLGGEAAAIGVSATLVVGVLIFVLDRLRNMVPQGVLPWLMLAAGEGRGK